MSQVDFFSARCVLLFGYLFVGGQEVVCSVGIEPPPPNPRPRSRFFNHFFACTRPSATDSHTSRGAEGRGARAPGVQEGRGVRVDDGGCERARLQPRLRRRGRLDWHRLEGSRAPRWLANGQLPRARRLCLPRLRGRWMGDHRLRGRRARRAAPRPPCSTTSSLAASSRSSSTAASRGAPHPMGPLRTPPVGCSSSQRGCARAQSAPGSRPTLRARLRHC